MKFLQVADKQDMARKAAGIIAAQVLLKNDSVLGLATGATPVGAYGQLAKWCREGEISFRDVITVNLDEYCGLPETSPQSYRYYMNENFFNQIDIDPANTHLPDGMAADMDAECSRYSALIRSLGGIDLQLLGIGMNGHIGFNEPKAHFVMDTHTVALSENTREVNGVYFENPADMPTHAVTMGMREILQAKRIVLMAGKEKEAILHRALEGEVTPEVPASLLQLHPRLTVVFEGGK